MGPATWSRARRRRAFRSPGWQWLPLSHTSTAHRPGGTPQEQPAARSEALSPSEALAKDSRAKGHDALKARGPTPPAAIGTTPPTPHTRLTSTRAPRPHGTPQEQPTSRSEALASLEALAKDSRAKEHDMVKERGPMPHAVIGTTPPTPHTRLTSTRAPRPHGTPRLIMDPGSTCDVAKQQVG